MMVVTACGDDPTIVARLGRAESAMEEHPDSALAILQSIDASALRTEKHSAHYALLYSQALDKNYIDITNDSLISIAVDYYSDSDDTRHRMLANYYMAVIQYNINDYTSSIPYLLSAEQDALDLNDDFFLYRIYLKLSEIYDLAYCNDESLSYAQIAFDKTSKIASHHHKLWAKLNLGRIYNNSANYDICIPIFNQIIDSAYTTNDHALLIEAMRLASISHLAKKNYAEVRRLLTSIMSIDSLQLTANDIRNLGEAYIGLGQLDSAIACIDQLNDLDPSEQWLTYKINKIKGNYLTALSALEHEYNVQDSLFLNITQQKISTAATAHRKSEKRMIENELANEQQLKHLLIALFVTIAIFSAIIYRQRIKNYKNEIEKNVYIAHNLKSTLELRESENSKMQQAINTLFEQKYETINNLCDIYFQSDAYPNKQNKVYLQIKSIIDNLGSDPKTILKLEEYANRYLNNIIIKFRNDYPNIKEADILLFLYSAIGFSSRAISSFLNENIDVIYNRKSRLKARIKASSATEKDTFLKYPS